MLRLTGRREVRPFPYLTNYQQSRSVAVIKTACGLQESKLRITWVERCGVAPQSRRGVHYIISRTISEISRTIATRIFCGR